MSNRVSDNKRIAKNAVFLYVRMIVMMAITLFTSREILRILGVDDFGIYNVIAGIVVLFAFLKTALVSASQRFISFEIGKGDEGLVKKTFSMSLNADVCLASVVVILSETVGLWFVNTHLNIPGTRMVAANILYQLSILTFVFDMLRIPFNSAIIAYEKMSFYAYISILEAVLKLAVVYMLTITGLDKLCVYGGLSACVSLLMLIAYYLYCRFHFKTCRYQKVWDKKYFLDMMSFSGFSMMSGIANVSAQQGGNIMLNMFVGLVANASFGVATQVSHAIYSFASNFHTAFSPQITKLYACDDKLNLYKLVFRSSLASYYLILILAVPFIFKMDFILGLWLEKVPDYAAGFCILMILYQLIDAFQSPLTTLIYSTGKIKGYTIWLCGLIFLNLPLSYLLLKIGMSVYVVLMVRFLINLVTAIIRIFFMKTLMDFPTSQYLKEVVLKSLLPTVTILATAYVLSLFIGSSIVSNLVFIVLCLILSSLISLLIGFTKSDRSTILSLVVKKIKR